jgi:hypothetical protein
MIDWCVFLSTLASPIYSNSAGKPLAYRNACIDLNPPGAVANSLTQ